MSMVSFSTPLPLLVSGTSLGLRRQTQSSCPVETRRGNRMSGLIPGQMEE